jgi:ribosomal protein L19
MAIGWDRGIMIRKGLSKGKIVKRKRLLYIRERRGKEGELIQTDGSPHD